MKKIIGLLLLSVMLMVFPGCKGDGNTAQNGTEIQGNDVVQNEEVTNVTEEMVRNHKVAPASDFTYALADDGIKIESYTGNDTIVVIPDTIDGKPVTRIVKLLFGYDSPVKGVYLPNTITEIDFLFANNDDLQVVICEGLEKILGSAFFKCVNMHTLVLGDSLNELSELAIASCKKLEEVYISPNVTEIPSYYAETVFFDSTNLTIVGEAGSYIESFAAKWGIPFRAK